MASVVDDVAEQLADGGYLIEYQRYDNKQEAEAALHGRGKDYRLLNRKAKDKVQTIVVVDLYLPINRAHIREINKGAGVAVPQRECGLELIKSLRSFGRNYSVIVWSNSRTDEDSRAIRMLGVSPENHLLKNEVERDGIVKALVRHIQGLGRHTVEFIEGSNNRDAPREGRGRKGADIRGYFRVDGIEVPLTLKEKQTLYALCKHDTTHLSKEKYLAQYVHNIRNKIHLRLAEAGISVGIDDIIEKRRGGYVLRAKFLSKADSERPGGRRRASYKRKPCRVLVVENEVDTSRFLCNQLKTFGFEVESAANVEDAVQKAREFSPHILSLDLHIPLTRAGEADRSTWTETGGLEALRQIRLSQHDIRAVIFTVLDLNQIAHVLHQAGQLGVSDNAYVRKGVPPQEGGTPESLLLTKIELLRDEIKDGRSARVSPGYNEPTVEILQGTDLKQGGLRLRVNGNLVLMKKSQLAEIIELLFENAGQLLSYEEIQRRLGLSEITDDNRKTWASRIRRLIRNKWLRLPKAGQVEPEKRILENSPESGMVLHARVIDQRKKAAKARRK